MKPWSGIALIAKFPLVALATLAGPLPAVAQTPNEPSLITEGALGCLLGMAPDGCQNIFANTRAAWRRTTYCTVEYTHRRLDNCYDGVLESVEYLGADAAGADVYDVKYMNAEMTYVIFQAAPDGKIPNFRIFDASPNAIIGRVANTMVAVTAPTDDTQPIYTRAEQGS